MTLKRLFIFMLLPMMMVLSWSASSAAEETQKIIHPEGGECKMDDEYKKQIAEQAVTALTGAKDNYAKYVKILKDDYKAEGGICHPLYKFWDHDGVLGFFGIGEDLQASSELSWTDADKNGAKVIDSGEYIAAPNPSCVSMIDDIDKDSGYSDWHIYDMREMAASSNAEVNDIIEWAKKAKDGDSKTVSDEVGKAICKAIGGCKNGNDCGAMRKSGNSIVCTDRGVMNLGQGGTLIIEYNGMRIACSWGNACTDNHDGTCTFMYGMSIKRITAPCKLSSSDFDKDDVAAEFGSADDLRKRVSEGDEGSRACVAKLDEAIELRKNFMNDRNMAKSKLSMLGGADVQCFCETDENQNPTDKIKDCISLQEEDKENLKRDCKTLPEYQAEFREVCLTCGLTAKILLAAQRISQGAFAALAGSLSALLAAAFLVFIGYTVLLTLASPEPQKLNKLMGSLLSQGAKVAIAVLLLNNGEFIYQNAINPILDSGVDFGLAFTNIIDADKDKDAASSEMDITLSTKIKDAGVEEITKSMTEIDGASKHLSALTIEKLVGANKNFSGAAAEVPAIGRCMICNSTHKLTMEKNLKVIPRLKMLVTGIILLVFGVMIWVAVGFYLLDCCLQLCIVAAMIPFFIACWPFKLTTQYVRVGWNMLLNTFFNFVMMSVVIVTIVLLIKGCLPSDLADDINGGNLDAINDKLELIGFKIIRLVVVCMICLKLSKESGRLANKFAGGAQVKMGGELGGLAADSAKKVAVGNLGKKGDDGKRQGPGGALGVISKAAGAIGGSAAEASGLKGWAKTKGSQIKNAAGGGTKSQGASFKQGDGGDKGGGGDNK